MTLNIIFHRFLKGINVSSPSSFWDREIDLTSENQVFQLLAELETEYHKHLDYPKIYSVGEQFISDVIEYKNSNQQHYIICNFIQFVAAVLIASSMSKRKLVGYSYNWVANAIGDVVLPTIPDEVEIGRIAEFISSEHPYIKKNWFLFLNLWTDALFYYSRLQKTTNSLAEYCIENYGDYILNPNLNIVIQYPFIVALCHIHSYAIATQNDKVAKKSYQFLKLLYDSQQLDAKWEVHILLQFSNTASEFSDVSTDECCGLLFSKYSSLLEGHQLLHVWVNFIGSSESRYWNNKKAIEKAIETYHSFLEERVVDRTLIAYELVIVYELLQPLVLTLLVSGFVDECENILRLFFRIKENTTKMSLLHIVPLPTSNILYCTSKTVIDQGKKEAVSLDLITQQTVDFLQLNKIDKARVGTPNAKSAQEYLDGLNGHFDFKSLTDDVDFATLEGYYLHLGTNLPLQPIILLQTNQVLPMRFSLVKPVRKRAFKNILFWKGDSMSSDLESNGVLEILENSNIHADVIQGSESTEDRFVNLYESDRYDVIIVSGHGIYDHFEPHNSYIQLSESLQLDLVKLSKFRKTWQNRRLLFLNICDGATTRLQNTPIAIGFSSSLVNNQQSVFSYLWPMDPRVALVIGWIFACCIKEDLDYPSIYRKIITLLIEGNEAVVQFLNKHLKSRELVETVENIDFNLSDFQYWGAIAYLE